MRRSFALLLPLVACASVARAHGIHETNAEQSFAERPRRVFELFIRDLAAMADIRIDEQGGYRFIESDGIANHATGRFPNAHNPNAIRAQSYRFRVPLHPLERGESSQVGHGNFGVAINGVPFDAATAEYWNDDRSSGWNIEALTGGIDLGLDRNNAHVQPNGAYHYHGVPTGLVEQFEYRSKPLRIGFAADGFPIYSPYGYRDPDDPGSGMTELRPSYRVRQGTRPSGPRGRYDGTYTRDYEYVPGMGDLDGCNGRRGVTPEYPQGTYYYVITDRFPFVPRCWVGSADPSFAKGPGGGGGGAPSGPRPAPGARRPPPQAVDACSGRAPGDSCAFSTPRGTLSGKCRSIGPDTACVPPR